MASEIIVTAKELLVVDKLFILNGW